MIDPKLNQVPVNRSAGGTQTQTTDATPVDPEQEERVRRNRSGLSIRDTIAGDSTLSVGSRGVDVSGVEAGSGSGAGSTSVTPGRASSPAPNIQPGVRGTGTTPRAATAPGLGPSSSHLSTNEVPGVTTEDFTDTTFRHKEIAARAYECWCERGCPEGSPEVDWHRAEEDLRRQRTAGGTTPRTSSAKA